MHLLWFKRKEKIGSFYSFCELCSFVVCKMEPRRNSIVQCRDNQSTSNASKEWFRCFRHCWTFFYFLTLISILMFSNTIQQFNTQWMKNETIRLILGTWALNGVQCSEISQKKKKYLKFMYSNRCMTVNRFLVELHLHILNYPSILLRHLYIQHGLQDTTAHHKS